jgi:hypothetical protein
METKTELKITIDQLNEQRENTLAEIGKTIRLAAKAGSIIAAARGQGENMRKLLDFVGLTEEQGRRLERVYRSEHKLASGNSGDFRQIYMWVDLSPDPITTSVPSERKSFFSPLIKVSQWFLNRSKPEAWTSDMRTEFIRYAEPIAKKYTELTDKRS